MEKTKKKLDDFLLTKEQEYWFNKGWNLAYKKIGLPETDMEIYWQKQREIVELKMLAIINLLPKEYGYYKKAIKIMINTKYFDLVFKKKEKDDEEDI